MFNCSLHVQSGTRWSERISAIRLVAVHLPGILKALEQCSELNLTPAGQTEVSSLKRYFGFFTAVQMSAIWIKFPVQNY